jgi:hypothetical protein
MNVSDLKSLSDPTSISNPAWATGCHGGERGRDGGGTPSREGELPAMVMEGTVNLTRR